MELAFEWDEEKALANLIKHGVTFLTASEIFDEEIIEQIDDREDYGELRWKALGRVDAVIYRVIYTWRGELQIRIISAQKASKREQAIYHRHVYTQSN